MFNSLCCLSDLFIIYHPLLRNNEFLHLSLIKFELLPTTGKAGLLKFKQYS